MTSRHTAQTGWHDARILNSLLAFSSSIALLERTAKRWKDLLHGPNNAISMQCIYGHCNA